MQSKNGMKKLKWDDTNAPDLTSLVPMMIHRSLELFKLAERKRRSSPNLPDKTTLLQILLSVLHKYEE